MKVAKVFQISSLLRSGSNSLFCCMLLVIFNFNTGYSQTTKVDNLHAELANAKTDLERATIMTTLTSQLINIDLEEAKKYAQKSLEFSRKIGDKENEASALNNLGLIIYESPDRPMSLPYFVDSERLSTELGLGELQSRTLMSIAKYHRYVSRDSTKTVENFLKSAEVSKSVNFHWGTGRSYAKLASFYTQYNDTDLCEKYLSLAVPHYEKAQHGIITIAHYYTEVGDKLWTSNPRKSIDFYLEGKKYSNTANLKTSLAKVYSFIGEYETALTYIEDAIPGYENIPDRKRRLGLAIAQLAEVHLMLGNYDAAEKASNQGIDVLANLGRSDQRANPSFYRVKGIIAEKKGEDDKAFNYYKKSLEEAERINVGPDRVKAKLALGNFLTKKNPKEARKYCHSSLNSTRKHKYTTLEIEACHCLYNINKGEGFHKDALRFHEQEIMLTDSLSASNVKHALEIHSKIAENERQVEALAHEKATSKSLLAITLLSLLFIGFLTFSYKRIIRQNQEINQKTNELKIANENLEQSNRELERFAHITSHDLKSPLRNIISFTELLRRNLGHEKKPIIKESLKFIEDNGKRMNKLIEDVLEYSTHTNQESNTEEVVNLEELIDSVFKLSHKTPNGKKYTTEVSKLPSVNWNSSQLFLLFKNIIENGLKYNESETPRISIYGEEFGEMYSIYIEDNGIGINPKYHEKIFVMFQRLHTQDIYEGTGLGLATCKKIVDEMGGRISINSDGTQGTIFKIEIPIRLIHSKDKQQDLNSNSDKIYKEKTKHSLNFN